MGGSGGPRGMQAMSFAKWKAIIALFLAATFGLMLLLSLPVSRLLPIRLPVPHPIQEALSPFELLIPPLFGEHGGRAPGKGPGDRPFEIANQASALFAPIPPAPPLPGPPKLPGPTPPLPGPPSLNHRTAAPIDRDDAKERRRTARGRRHHHHPHHHHGGWTAAGRCEDRLIRRGGWPGHPHAPGGPVRRGGRVR
jgi:hypothetical protein